MQVGILGPLEVRDDGDRPVEVSGARLRTLLVRLALDAGRPVPASALVDAVWGDRPPADEANALQTLVSRLRRALGDAAPVEPVTGRLPAGGRPRRRRRASLRAARRRRERARCDWRRRRAPAAARARRWRCGAVPALPDADSPSADAAATGSPSCARPPLVDRVDADIASSARLAACCPSWRRWPPSTRCTSGSPRR